MSSRMARIGLNAYRLAGTVASPVVGLALPGYARLTFQYDVVRDLLAKDARGVPVDLKNDRWTLRLQVGL